MCDSSQCDMLQMVKGWLYTLPLKVTFCLHSVSYTHLDVYKRQLTWTSKFLLPKHTFHCLFICIWRTVFLQPKLKRLAYF